jgi:hypothetical protein
MALEFSNSPFLPNLSLSFSGTSMHLTKPMMIVAATLVPSLLLVPGRLQVRPTNKKLIPRARQKQNLLRFMTNQEIFCGLAITSKLKAIINENIIFQDNMSTLSLEKNGRTSSSKRTKHIKAKYFSIQHYHQTKEIDLRYCPTDNMWANVLTKPLQGSKFQQMRAILMNCQVDYNEEPPMIAPILVSSSSNVP